MMNKAKPRTPNVQNRATMEGIDADREGINAGSGVWGKHYFTVTYMGFGGVGEDGGDKCGPITYEHMYVGQGASLGNSPSMCGRDLSPPSPPSPPDWRFSICFQLFAFSLFSNLSPPVFTLSPPSPPDKNREKQRVVEIHRSNAKSCNLVAA